MDAQPSPGSSSSTDDKVVKKRGAPDFKKSIKRGSACLACRSKKLKCDGERPVCGKCAKSRLALGGTSAVALEAFPCEFEDLPDGTKRRRVSSKQVEALEQKLARLQQQADAMLASTSLTYASPSLVPSFLESDYAGDGFGFGGGSLAQILGQNVEIGALPSPSSSASTARYMPDAFSFPAALTRATVTPATSAASSPQSSSILPSSYPLNLPSIPVMTRIVKTFIHSIHPGASLFQPAFTRRLALAPSHHNFPSAALLYAIAGLATELFGTAVLEEESAAELACGGRGMGLRWDGSASPAQWYIDRARVEVRDAVGKSVRLYEAGQALNLICHYTHRICHFSDIWTLSGETVRLAVALGLNHLSKPSVCLSPPVDAAEEQDRRNNFWWAFTGNNFASANTGWATSLQPEDITTLLPSLTYPTMPKDREREWRALSHWSPEFYHFQPPQHVGGTQLLFKAMLLLGRSVVHPSRCPTFGHPVSVPKNEVTPQDVRNDPDFIALSNDIDAFILSTSSFAADEPTSPYISLIQAVPHVCRIMLHEQLVTRDMNDWSLLISLDAARRVFATVKGADDFGASSFEMLPWIDLCWSVAARTFVRSLAVKEAWGDPYGAPELRDHVHTIINCVESYHTLHTDNIVAVLRRLVENPSVCLPQCSSSVPSRDTRFQDEGLSATAASMALLLAEQQATIGRLSQLE